MSVATKNPFALLDEDDSSPPPTPAPPAVPQPPAEARGAAKSRGGPASRGGKYYPRGGANGAQRDRQNTAEEPAVGGEEGKRQSNGEDRGRGRGRGRGGRGGMRGGRLDRHSATGKTDSDKKVHQSWGGDDGDTELKVEEAANNDVAAEVNVSNDWAGTAPADDGWGAPAAGENGAAPAAPATAEGEQPEGRRRERDAEEEDNTLTLDQYLAQQKEKDATAVPKLEVRKANEGVDDSTWEGVALKKEEESIYFAGKPKSGPNKARIEKKEKVYLEIDARFERPDRGRGRGRGGDRGVTRSVRGRGRAPAGPAAPVNVHDENAFPSLS